MMNKLNSETVKLITSTQVITSISSIVKELIENSLDAGATSVDVLLANHGLDRIEVRDDGKGIRKTDVPFVGLRHYTSKISSDADLTCLSTLGFRGEALASLCAVAQVSLITRTENDASGTCYVLSRSGQVTSEKPYHGGRGTTVVACKLYADLPVRKLMYSDARKKKQGLKELEHLMTRFGLAHPTVRFGLKHDKEQIVLKNKSNGTLEAVGQIFGVASTLSKVLRCEMTEETFSLTAFMAPFGDDGNRRLETKTFVSINARPVVLREIDKKVRHAYGVRGLDARFKTAFCVIDLKIPAENLDVNLSPNKWDVMLKDAEDLFAKFDRVLEGFLKADEKERSTQTTACDQPIPDRPLSSASLKSVEASNPSSADESIEGEYFERVLTGNKIGVKPPSSVDADTRIDEDPIRDVTDFRRGLGYEEKSDRENPSHETNLKSFRDRDGIEWSKGTLLKDGNDENVEPVALSVPRRDADRFEKPTTVPVESLATHAAPASSAAPKQQTLFEAFSPRQKPRGDRVGFKEFERKMRAEIIKENRDGVSFAKVTELVESRWERLDDEERMNYEAAELLQPNRFTEKNLLGSTSGWSKPSSSKSGPEKKIERRFGENKDRDLSSFSDRKRRKRSPDRVGDRVNLAAFRPKRPRVTAAQRVVEVDCRWNDIFDRAKSKARKKKRITRIAVVGPIRDESRFGWILSENHGDGNDSLFALNSHRLVEMTMFRQLVDGFALPLGELPHPERLPDRLLDHEMAVESSSLTAMDALLELAQKRSEYRKYGEVTLDDARLVKNGFVLRLSRDDASPHGASAELLSSSDVVSEVDFKHMIGCIVNGAQSVAACRSANVKNYLRRECQRVAKSAPLLTDKCELLDTLKDLTKRKWKEMDCLHGKKLFHEIESSKLSLPNESCD